MIESDGRSSLVDDVLVPNSDAQTRTRACCELRITRHQVQLGVSFAVDLAAASAVAVAAGIVANETAPRHNESTEIPGSRFNSSVLKMPQFLYTAIAAELSVNASRITGPAAGAAGGNISLMVELLNRWGEHLPCDAPTRPVCVPPTGWLQRAQGPDSGRCRSFQTWNNHIATRPFGTQREVAGALGGGRQNGGIQSLG